MHVMGKERKKNKKNQVHFGHVFLFYLWLFFALFVRCGATAQLSQLAERRLSALQSNFVVKFQKLKVAMLGD